MYLEQWQIDHYKRRQLAIEAELAALDACLLAFIANPTQSYSLNTGQTSQQVTRASLPALRAWRDGLHVELFDLLGALNASPRSLYVRPGF